MCMKKTNKNTKNYSASDSKFESYVHSPTERTLLLSIKNNYTFPDQNNSSRTQLRHSTLTQKKLTLIESFAQPLSCMKSAISLVCVCARIYKVNLTLQEATLAHIYRRLRRQLSQLNVGSSISSQLQAPVFYNCFPQLLLDLQLH